MLALFKRSTTIILGITLIFTVILVTKNLAVNKNSPQKNVLSASSVPNPTPNCKYYQDSWIQFKRDFKETQYKNYPNSKSAEQSLKNYFQTTKQQVILHGCELNY